MFSIKKIAEVLTTFDPVSTFNIKEVNMIKTDFRLYFVVSALCLALLAPRAAWAQESAAASALGEALMSMDGSAENAIEAATGWHVCDVVRTGAGWGNHYVALTCPSGPFTNKWHRMISNQKDPMLATALAAATSGKKVQVYIASGSPYNEIRALYWHK